jgi:hypothetical protein
MKKPKPLNDMLEETRKLINIVVINSGPAEKKKK